MTRMPINGKLNLGVFGQQPDRIRRGQGPTHPEKNWPDAAGSEAELEQRRKADAEKIKFTRRLRAETTMTWACIAKRLAMGTSGYTADRLPKTWHDMRICGTRLLTENLWV